MKKTLITLALVAVALTACDDPLGYTTRTQIRANNRLQLAEIDAATERATLPARIGGAIALAGIAALTVIGVSLIAGGTHIVAQRDRLSMDDWRNQLPVVPIAAAVTDGRRPGARPMPLLEFTQRRRAPVPTLALPEHSSTHDVVVIDA